MNDEEKKAAAAILKKLAAAESDEQMTRASGAYCALTQGALNRISADANK